MQLPTPRTYRRLFLVLACLGFAVDQVSKYGIFAYLYDGPDTTGRIEVIRNLFDIEAGYTSIPGLGDPPLSWLRTLSSPYLPKLNEGALFGIGDGNNRLFTFISLAAALAILFWGNRPQPATDRFLIVTLGLILAGTLGNLYDRAVFGGVRDFLHFRHLPLPFGLDDWPVFNIADCCLVCGASLLVLQAMFSRDLPEPTTERPQAVVQEASSAGSI